MEAKRISQQDLATALGLTRAAVGHYLAGRRRPSLDQMTAIAAALDVDLVWLLQGPDHAVAESRLVPARVPVLGGTRSGLTEDLSARRGWYALKVEGSEYSPRIHAGEVAVLDPDRAPEAGDEVLVVLRDGGLGLHVLVRQGPAQVTLETIAGDRVRRAVPRKDIRFMHRLVAVFVEDPESASA
jgi:transcriptional regulator with XRE-family HTH domain